MEEAENDVEEDVAVVEAAASAFIIIFFFSEAAAADAEIASATEQDGNGASKGESDGRNMCRDGDFGCRKYSLRLGGRGITR